MKSRKRQKRIIASMLTTLFVAQQSMLLSVVASEISGVNGNNGIYNINPSALINGTDMGYRKYKDFTLDKGDIANLIYKYGNTDVSTFINLVDNKININGIVNTMRDGNFYNGKAIFVSPNGMVVGASGVLNVGSLGVYTPNDVVYTRYKENPQADLTSLQNSYGGKPVTINGKVFAANDVELNGGKVSVGKTGGVIAGINENKMAMMNTNQQAENLFNQLVNTDNLNTGNAFSSNNGNIYIKSNQRTEDAGVDIAGTVKNFGKGNTEIRSTGVDGIKISGTVANADGLLKVNNNWGDVNISGTVKNNGETQIFNSPGEGKVTFTVNGQEYSYQLDTNNSIDISGNIDTKGKLTINNTGDKGINISGTVNNDGTLSIQNGIAGDSQSAKTRNERTEALKISGTVNNNGTADITNYGKGGLNVTETGIVENSNGKLAMTNNGEGGFTVDGNISNVNGDTTLTNTAGFLTVNGNVQGINNSDIYLDNSGSGIEINGNINANKTASNGSSVNINNTNGAINLNSTGRVNATKDINVTNSGNGGVNVKG
ncbi:TPA: hypothetical protein CPT84_00395, partial [Candidatus Gastranaerophilales bacterium HUM_12]